VQDTGRCRASETDRLADYCATAATLNLTIYCICSEGSLCLICICDSSDDDDRLHCLYSYHRFQMFTLIPSLCFLLLVSLPTGTGASPSAWKSSLFPRFVFSPEGFHRRLDSTSGLNYNPNGSAFLWLPQDTYAGQSFFEQVVVLFCTLLKVNNQFFLLTVVSTFGVLLIQQSVYSFHV